MKVLLINKFLYPKGGSETYVFKLGETLQRMGHEVQYFGMEHSDNVVGNAVGEYTQNVDFHSGSPLKLISGSLNTVYSSQARKKIRKVLDGFKPDVCHLNNFNYQLTPSIILEIVKWRKQNGRDCRIIYTAHDLQLVCPNHLMLNPVTGEICEKCLGGKYHNCISGKCIHGSAAKSIFGAAEAYYWKAKKVYRYIDAVVSPSAFLAQKLATRSELKDKITVMQNFVGITKSEKYPKGGYVLYFGRYSKEKGVETLLRAVDSLPDVKFVFAGSGPLEQEIEKRSNVVNRGFVEGEELVRLVSQADFSVVPSECYENCPFTVIESRVYGTPVLGADIGGIPELVDNGVNGELFESGNAEMLAAKIKELSADKAKLEAYAKNCFESSFFSAEKYCAMLTDIYSVKSEESR